MSPCALAVPFLQGRVHGVRRCLVVGVRLFPQGSSSPLLLTFSRSVSWYQHGLEEMDKTLSGLVLLEKIQKYDKAGQTCSLCWDFWRFFCTSQRRDNSSVGWSFMIVLSRYSVSCSVGTWALALRAPGPWLCKFLPCSQ